LTEIDPLLAYCDGDLEGEIIETKGGARARAVGGKPAKAPRRGECGVPALSAIKIGGERAYRLTRRGEAPEMPLRRSRIDELQLLDYSNGIARLDLTRQLRHLRACDRRPPGRHCHSLRRLDGPLLGLGRRQRAHHRRPTQFHSFRVELSEEETDSVRAGRQLQRGRAGVAATVREGRLIARRLGKNGTVRPETVMPV